MESSPIFSQSTFKVSYLSLINPKFIFDMFDFMFSQMISQLSSNDVLTNFFLFPLTEMLPSPQSTFLKRLGSLVGLLFNNLIFKFNLSHFNYSGFNTHIFRSGMAIIPQFSVYQDFVGYFYIYWPI